MFFLIAGTACAADMSNVSISEDSNLTNDNANALSQEKLEISSEDSISETNIVNSHDDNLKDYPEDDVLTSGIESYYEDNGEQKLGLVNEDSEIAVYSGDDSLLGSSAGDILSATGNIATSLSVSDTHYGKSATYFKVTLQDKDGKALSGQKISLKVKSKTYTATTNSKGIANVKTDSLAVGTYSLTTSYAGSSNYSSSSLSKKVKVLSSVSGNDLTKYFTASKYYSATFWKDNEVLSNTKVAFNIGGKKYTFTTNKNGVATAKVTLKPGKYSVTAINPYSGEKISNSIVVKKDTATISGIKKTYILPYNYYTYTVTLTSAHGGPLKNCKVVFNYDGKNATAKTDSKGKASTVIPLLDEGTYKISYKYSGSSGVSGCSASGTICIKSASTTLTASNLKMNYDDGSKFNVKASNSAGVLKNKKIKFQLNNKNYYIKTNSKGIAQLPIGDLNPGTYKIRYSYSSLGESDYNYGYKNVVINRVSAKILAYHLVVKYNDGKSYKATVKDSSGKVLKQVSVKFTVNGKSYTKKTDSNGVAKLKIDLPVGYYSIKTGLSDSVYTASEVSKRILVNGTKFTASDLYVGAGSNVYYSVKLIDGKSNAVKSAAVKFTVNGKTYTKKTNSNGVAKINVGKLNAGNYKVKYSYDSSKGTSTIHVIDSVTLKQIIAASKSVKSYIEKNNKLPSNVQIGKLQYSTAEYLYLASKAIVNLDANKKSDIAFKKVKNPKSPGKAADMENLDDYLSVAKSLIKTADSKGQMPNSVSSDVGSIGYKGIVYAFARVVAYYGDNDMLPNYVAIKSLSSSSGSTSKLNSKNTISNLASYLAASTNCQVNNSKIKQLVTKLTKGLTSDTAKATAIYNYVRDTISYSFYYDTKYGAVGTLNAKTGNCVDHSHLLVAMYRTAGLAARYAHGTCTFTSGTYGHVWTQVLIGDTWVVSDATSTRNSFGNVVNWNANSYSLKGYYASISF